MRKITTGEFKKRCEIILEEVRSTRESIFIMKRGRPIAKLVPVGKAPEFLGRLQHVVKINGDIESPVEPARSWKTVR